MITRTVSDLTADLLAEGFDKGPPSHLTAEDVMADIESYRLLECEACGHSRHDVRAFHCDKEYRLVCVCRHCGHAVEM